MIVLYIALMLVVGSAAIAGISAAPWVPTRSRDRGYLLDNLKLHGNETIIDLGCGDGSLLFDAARRSPGIRGIGYDISLLPLCIAWARKLLFWRTYRPIAIRFGNLFTADITHADVIYIFLLGKAYDRLKEKLAKEMRPEAIVALEAWPLPNCTPFRTLRGENMLPVYIYRGSDLQ